MLPTGPAPIIPMSWFVILFSPKEFHFARVLYQKKKFICDKISLQTKEIIKINIG